jgi:hypothetical protein
MGNESHLILARSLLSLFSFSEKQKEVGTSLKAKVGIVIIYSCHKTWMMVMMLFIIQEGAGGGFLLAYLSFYLACFVLLIVDDRWCC